MARLVLFMHVRLSNFVHNPQLFLSVRKVDLKKGFQHLVVFVVLLVLVLVVVRTRVKKSF
jgi:hypothetical protein